MDRKSTLLLSIDINQEEGQKALRVLEENELDFDLEDINGYKSVDSRVPILFTPDGTRRGLERITTYATSPYTKKHFRTPRQ